uniref:Uncharacterized protein n=1 Tax=Arundo donax TaxID=35708 RepID=A0A0A8Y9I4_ARUDO
MKACLSGSVGEASFGFLGLRCSAAAVLFIVLLLCCYFYT